MAATRLPVPGRALDQAAQARVEQVDGLVRALRLDLGPHQAAVEVEVGLGHDRPADGRVTVP